MVVGLPPRGSEGGSVSAQTGVAPSCPVCGIVSAWGGHWEARSQGRLCNDPM